jgi:hypothetical protein
MTVIVSCSVAEGPLDLAGDDGTTGSYTISVAGTENGSIKANRIKANAGQSITIIAAPEAASGWKGSDEALAALKGGGGVTTAKATMMTTTLGI